MAGTNKNAKPKLSDEDAVSLYMQQLQHPLKAEVELLRKLIKSSDPLVSERIKWNAPSYHYKGIDFLTFNLRDQKRVHLVFHHPGIVKVQSSLLEGDYKDRRMMYFGSVQEINAHTAEFNKILKDAVKNISL